MVLKDTLDALFVPSWREFGRALHLPFLLMRRRKGGKRFASQLIRRDDENLIRLAVGYIDDPQGNVPQEFGPIAIRAPSRPGRSSLGDAKTSSTSSSSTPCEKM